MHYTPSDNDSAIELPAKLEADLADMRERLGVIMASRSASSGSAWCQPSMTRNFVADRIGGAIHDALDAVGLDAHTGIPVPVAVTDQIRRVIDAMGV